MAKKQKLLKITLVRSLNKKLDQHKACIHGLGLRRLHQTVTVTDDPCIRGMINKVSYLLQVTEA
jgi:large subunit ribosomal protein L30